MHLQGALTEESSLIYSELLKVHYVVLGKKFWSEEKVDYALTNKIHFI